MYIYICSVQSIQNGGRCGLGSNPGVDRLCFVLKTGRLADGMLNNDTGRKTRNKDDGGHKYYSLLINLRYIF